MDFVERDIKPVCPHCEKKNSKNHRNKRREHAHIQKNGLLLSALS